MVIPPAAASLQCSRWPDVNEQTNTQPTNKHNGSQYLLTVVKNNAAVLTGFLPKRAIAMM